jgi:RimJ/RimL family protein N-acetyltransferase
MLIQPLAPQDQTLYCELFSDKQAMLFVGEPLPQYRIMRGFKAALRARQRNPLRQIFFSVRDKQRNDAVGLCCVQRIDPMRQRAEIGLMLQQRVQGQGIGKEVVAVLTETALAKLPVREIWAQYAADNEAASRLFATLGFRPVPCSESDGIAEQVQARVWTLYSQSSGASSNTRIDPK